MPKPNFLFLFPDHHRGDWMPYSNEVFLRLGMQGLDLRMENIARLMREGVGNARSAGFDLAASNPARRGRAASGVPVLRSERPADSIRWPPQTDRDGRRAGPALRCGRGSLGDRRSGPGSAAHRESVEGPGGRGLSVWRLAPACAAIGLMEPLAGTVPAPVALRGLKLRKCSG